jgi:cytochrome c553
MLLLPGAALGQPSDGQNLAKHGTEAGVPPCASCHGALGEGQASGAGAVPRLAGLSRDYLVKQVDDYRQGRRHSDIMQPIAGTLTADEVSALAAYYSELEAPRLAGPTADGEAIQLGERLATIGKWEGELPPCMSCHGPKGVGVAPSFPYLAGQSAGYITAQVAQWRSGERNNDPLDLMKTVARGLDERETAAVAAYFQTLTPPKRQGVP